MKKLLVILLLFPAFSYATNIKKITFFKNTQFPLTAFFLKGEQPGPTIMVQGGIQGDEICGVLTAQSLLGSRVIKGNIIVVPRANVPSREIFSLYLLVSIIKDCPYLLGFLSSLIKIGL